MADMSRPATAEGRESRRGSLARAFDKVRAAMKRRSSSARDVLAPSAAAAGGQDAEDGADKALEPTSSANAPGTEPRIETTTHQVELRIPLAPRTSAIPAEEQLEVDDAADDNDEPLLPMPLGRTRMTAEQAREVFVQNSIYYLSRSERSQQEPPAKIRRVEKAVRLRMHWTCHSCSTPFGRERTCPHCAHRRCRECLGHPPKRVRELSELSRVAMEQEQQQAEQSTGAHEKLRSEEPLRPQDRAATPVVVGLSVSPSMAVGEDASAHDEGVDDNYALTTCVRPRSAVTTVLKPKAQIVRRTCHKCSSHIVPVSRADCQNCGHIKCDRCPRYPSKAAKWGRNYNAGQKIGDDDEDDDIPMVRAVQRVYRRPRQRVRYTCEQCSSVFTDRDNCEECGHPRCGNCPREPPRRAPREYDIDIVQAVADRLGAYEGTLGQPPGITMSAG